MVFFSFCIASERACVIKFCHVMWLKGYTRNIGYYTENIRLTQIMVVEFMSIILNVPGESGFSRTGVVFGGDEYPSPPPPPIHVPTWIRGEDQSWPSAPYKSVHIYLNIQQWNGKNLAKVPNTYIGLSKHLRPHLSTGNPWFTGTVIMLTGYLLALLTCLSFSGEIMN